MFRNILYRHPIFMDNLPSGVHNRSKEHFANSKNTNRPIGYTGAGPNFK